MDDSLKEYEALTARLEEAGRNLRKTDMSSECQAATRRKAAELLAARSAGFWNAGRLSAACAAAAAVIIAACLVIVQKPTVDPDVDMISMVAANAIERELAGTRVKLMYELDMLLTKYDEPVSSSGMERLQVIARDLDMKSTSIEKELKAISDEVSLAGQPGCFEGAFDDYAVLIPTGESIGQRYGLDFIN